MESVTIQSVVAKKTGAKNGKPWTISEVTLTDGRKVDTFDSFVNGETVNVDITPNAKPEYNANMKKAKSAGQQNAGNFANAQAANNAIDFNKEKDQRISMLSCIASSCTYYAQREADETKVMNFARKLFTLALKRDGTGIPTDDLPF